MNTNPNRIKSAASSQLCFWKASMRAIPKNMTNTAKFVPRRIRIIDIRLLILMRAAVNKIPKRASYVSHEIADNSGRDNKRERVAERERINGVLNIQKMQAKDPIQE